MTLTTLKAVLSSRILAVSCLRILSLFMHYSSGRAAALEKNFSGPPPLAHSCTPEACLQPASFPQGSPPLPTSGQSAFSQRRDLASQRVFRKGSETQNTLICIRKASIKWGAWLPAKGKPGAWKDESEGRKDVIKTLLVHGGEVNGGPHTHPEPENRGGTGL